jgi:hypothetical protein
MRIPANINRKHTEDKGKPTQNLHGKNTKPKRTLSFILRTIQLFKVRFVCLQSP